MKGNIRVTAPPARPLLIFDGDCRFCALWIKRWQQTTADRVDYLPFQDLSIPQRFPEIPSSHFEKSVQLVEIDGAVYEGAEAAIRSLAHNPNRVWLLRLYDKLPFFAAIAEVFYAFVARNRRFFSFLTRLGWGQHVERPTHFLVQSFFLRGLALVYFCAFLSLWAQITGLIGKGGIQPAEQTMQAVHQQVEQQHIGISRYRLFPTLCWWNSSDNFLTSQCVAGAVISLFAFVGLAPPLCFFLLWLLYLSLTTIGVDFLSFQWDNLLLETGFLAIFFASWQWLPRLKRWKSPSLIILWLLRWLIFRLMFESGWVKFLSGDPTWKNLTALNFHYETQPLPTWLGWYAHQLPENFQKFSVLMMFFIELVLPFFIFGPRRLRMFAAFNFIVLEILIALTGNYCFFNLLTIVLCVPLLDDFFLGSLIKQKWKDFFGSNGAAETSNFSLSSENRLLPRLLSRSQTILYVFLAIIIVSVTSLPLVKMFDKKITIPAALASVHNWLSPFRTFNQYGLFAVMTTSRPEIIIEGSNDGQTWLSYEFKHKPGNLKRRPGFIAPHQPRLDWQMWFAALGTYRDNPWFINFCVRLLQSSPDVLALLKTNPFPDKPPLKIRAITYSYHFTDSTVRGKTNEWWRREQKEVYCPELQLKPQ